MDLTQSQKQKIEEVGKAHNLKLILLHGSYVNGKARKDSDLDIAFLGKKPIDFREQLEIHAELAGVFGDSRERELDTKSLHRRDPLFVYQVAKNSQLLFGDVSDYNEFRAYAFKNYFDSQDLFRLEKKLIYKFQDYLNKKYA